MALGRDTTITWFGHGTYQIDTPGGKRILVDPWLSGNPSCPEHLRSPARCDVMLVTHGHYDHIGDAIAVARTHAPVVVAGFEVCHWLERQGVERCSPMNKGGTQEVAGVRFTMTHAIHSGGILDDDRIVSGGDAAGYVIRLENDLAIYAAGDTALFGDMGLIGEVHRPELAILPSGDHFTMGPADAARAVRLIGCKHVLGIHWGTFPLLTGTPEALRAAASDIDGLEVHALQPGESLS